MGNVNLPTPVALAGASICVLGGYLLGVVAGPDTTSSASATVESYDPGSRKLCLVGAGAREQEGADPSGRLCGVWRRTEEVGAPPRKGDRFRFIAVAAEPGPPGSGQGRRSMTVIYGDVAR